MTVFSDYWLSTKNIDVETAIPARYTSQFFQERISKRRLWRFVFDDGSVWTTYDVRRAMDLLDRMMKAGRING